MLRDSMSRTIIFCPPKNVCCHKFKAIKIEIRPSQVYQQYMGNGLINHPTNKYIIIIKFIEMCAFSKMYHYVQSNNSIPKEKSKTEKKLERTDAHKNNLLLFSEKYISIEILNILEKEEFC